jgi:putative aldouronate transport system permease protein
MPAKKKDILSRLGRDMKMNYPIYLMVLPALIYYFLFSYMPMYGAQIAFKDFNPNRGIWNSPWVGLKHYISFFNSYYPPAIKLPMFV